MRSLAFLAAAAVAAFALAGCSGSSGSSGSSSSMSGGMSGMHMAKTVDVAMQGNKFVNDTVTIYVGDTVKWTNKDTVSHTVTTRAGQAESFDSNPNCTTPLEPAPFCMPTGATYTHTFTKAGTTEYYCRVHSMMTAKVIVLEPSRMAMSGSMSGSMSMSMSTTHAP